MSSRCSRSLPSPPCWRSSCRPRRRTFSQTGCGLGRSGIARCSAPRNHDAAPGLGLVSRWSSRLRGWSVHAKPWRSRRSSRSSRMTFTTPEGIHGGTAGPPRGRDVRPLVMILAAIGSLVLGAVFVSSHLAGRCCRLVRRRGAVRQERSRCSGTTSRCTCLPCRRSSRLRSLDADAWSGWLASVGAVRVVLRSPDKWC